MSRHLSVPLACFLAISLTDMVAAEEAKEVEVKAITLSVPESWEQEPASNRLRLAQFTIKPEAEESDAEIVVYSFGGGGGGVRCLQFLTQREHHQLLCHPGRGHVDQRLND